MSMRIDVETCRDPDLLAGEVRRLQAVIAANEQRDAAGPVDFGGLTGEERDALEAARYLAAWGNGGTVAARISELLERTKEATNMNDENEPSLASTGSHPVSGGPITLRLSNEEQQEMLSRLSGRQSGTLVPLDLPQPTLTDEQRDAIEYGVMLCDATAGMANDRDTIDGASSAADVLRGMLERRG
jgi:hypothetical protein